MRADLLARAQHAHGRMVASGLPTA
jgi:hypothetical protein